MDTKRKQITALLFFVVLLFCSAFLTSCVGLSAAMTKKGGMSLEQQAIRNAITMCQKFGHKEQTKEFTRCAEQRYDEFLIRNQ